MSISMANPGDSLTIIRISGSEKIKAHLQNLGFIEGEPVLIINKISENIIVKIKGVFLAITYDLARKILV